MKQEEQRDPIKDLYNMNLAERTFFWASFDKATGSEEPYISLLWKSFLRRIGYNLLTLIILAVGALVFGGIVYVLSVVFDLGLT